MPLSTNQLPLPPGFLGIIGGTPATPTPSGYTGADATPEAAAARQAADMNTYFPSTTTPSAPPTASPTTPTGGGMVSSPLPRHQNPPSTTSPYVGSFGSGPGSYTEFGLGAGATPPDQTVHATGASGDLGGLAGITQRMVDTRNRAETLFNSFQQGTVPLNSYQQSQVDAAKATWDSLIQDQILENKNFEGGTAVAQETRGLSRYSPEMAVGNIFAAVTEGNKKVADLQTKKLAGLSAMQQAFQDANYRRAKESYESIQQADRDITTNLENMYKVVQEQEKKVTQEKQQVVLAGINEVMYDPSLPWDEKQKKIALLVNQGNLSPDQIKDLQSSLRTIRQDEVTNKLNDDKFSWQQKIDLLDAEVKAGNLETSQARLALDVAKEKAAGTIPLAPGETSVIDEKANTERLKTVNLLNSILTDPYLSNATGMKVPGAWFGGILGSAVGNPVIRVINKLKQLTAILALENRGKLKGTGAISDFESKTLEASASAFSVGLDDEQAFHELVQIRGALLSMSGEKAMVRITDRSGKSQIFKTDSKAINEAVRAGLLVQYVY